MEIIINSFNYGSFLNNSCDRDCNDCDNCYCDCDDCGCDNDRFCSGDGTPCTQD